MRAERTCFIAETDPNGTVAWVWIFGADDRIARPVSDPAKYIVDLSTADVFGATRAEVHEWLNARR